MSFATITHRAEGGVLHLTLNRPEVRNAMSMAMVRELRHALSTAETDGRTRIIVLRGAGGHFCAGADLKDMTNARLKLSGNPDGLVNVNAAFGELCTAFASTGLAVIAVLEGTVMGGGFGLSCVADVVLADDTVLFRLPETSLGIVPAQIAPYLVERLGYSEAKRLAVTGGRIDAQQALALRLVHQVHSPQTIDASVARTIEDILQCAPGAIAATKALIATARWQAPAELVRDAAQVFSRAALGPEGNEGTSAFLQKRKPSWAPPQ